MDPRTFILLYKALVRPHVEYANSVWSPTKGDIQAIENIQKRTTKLVISLRKLPYKERLQHLNLYSLKYRRIRGDDSRPHSRFIFPYWLANPSKRLANRS